MNDSMCSVVKDLLPLYCEKITREETNQVIHQHLEVCRDCRNYKDMIENDKLKQQDKTEKSSETVGIAAVAKRLRRRKRIIITSTVCSFLLLFVILTQTFQTFYVSGASMEPSYKAAQSCLVNKLAYLFQSPKEGDVIIFLQNSGSIGLKRVIAGPGDTVLIKDGDLYVNGTVQKIHASDSVNVDGGDLQYPVKLNSDEYFVMGDNSNVSLDSRFQEFGMVKENTIIGKVIGKAISFASIQSNVSISKKNDTQLP